METHQSSTINQNDHSIQPNDYLVVLGHCMTANSHQHLHHILTQAPPAMFNYISSNSRHNIAIKNNNYDSDRTKRNLKFFGILR